MKLQTALLASLIYIAPAAQAETYLIPRIGMEYQMYETEFATGEYASPALGLSLLHSSGVYFDISVVTYAEGAADEETENVSVGDSKVSDRDEITFTGGYRFDSGIILFAGLLDTMTSAVKDGNYIEFGSQGPFVGISNSYKVNNYFSASLSGAIASLAGQVSGNNQNFSYDYDGSAIGYSINSALNISIYKGLMGAIGARHQSYDYGDEIAKEEVTSVFAKLAYRF